MKITALKRRKGARDLLNVYVDGTFAFTVPEEVALGAGLRAGLSIDEERVASLKTQEAAWSTRAAALELLAYRQRSVSELRDRLRRKSFPPEAIEHCISELQRSKLVDDAEFARTFVRERTRGRPRGRRVLHAELRARGIDEALATAMITEVLGGAEPVDEMDLARRAARRFRTKRDEDPAVEGRRLYAFLARKGFEHDTIRAVIDERKI